MGGAGGRGQAAPPALPAHHAVHLAAQLTRVAAPAPITFYCGIHEELHSSFSAITQPRMHQSAKSLCPSPRGDPDDSKTPPTCKNWMILSQVMALPKKQCFEIIKDLLVFGTKMVNQNYF